MNVRHAYSKEDPSPDERYIWGSLVDDSDALALLRIAYADGKNRTEAELEDEFQRDAETARAMAYQQGLKDGERGRAA